MLLLLSNCSTATDWGGDTCRRICTLPGRHAHGGRLWLPRCGSGRGRNGQSYSTITPVRGKWASDIKCSTHSCSYRVLSVTATPPHTDIQRFLFNHIQSLSLEDLSRSFLKPNYTPPRTGCFTQCCWREPRNRTWANIGIYVLLFKLIQYYCHWIVGEREDIGRPDSLVACGYGCRTTSVSNIHHLSVTPPHSDEREVRRGSVYTPSFFLSIFSLNNRANSSPNAATPLSVNTE